jgi:four helix bundle protein
VKENVIAEKSFRFALLIIELCRKLRELREYELSRQLFKSGTSIGANVEEAQAGQSRADFLSKMSIAAKEARESRYWLRLINDDPVLSEVKAQSHLAECEEIVRILTSIAKTTGDR